MGMVSLEWIVGTIMVNKLLLWEQGLFINHSIHLLLILFMIIYQFISY